jgi:hypothetical protein
MYGCTQRDYNNLMTCAHISGSKPTPTSFEVLAPRVSSSDHEPDMRSLPQVGEITGFTLFIPPGSGAWNISTRGLPWLPPVYSGEVSRAFPSMIIWVKKQINKRLKYNRRKSETTNYTVQQAKPCHRSKIVPRSHLIIYLKKTTNRPPVTVSEESLVCPPRARSLVPHRTCIVKLFSKHI